MVMRMILKAELKRLVPSLNAVRKQTAEAAGSSLLETLPFVNNFHLPETLFNSPACKHLNIRTSVLARGVLLVSALPGSNIRRRV